MSSPPRTKRETPPRLPSKKQRSSLTPIQTEAIANRLPQDKYSSVDGIYMFLINHQCTYLFYFKSNFCFLLSYNRNTTKRYLK